MVDQSAVLVDHHSPNKVLQAVTAQQGLHLAELSQFKWEDHVGLLETLGDFVQSRDSIATKRVHLLEALVFHLGDQKTGLQQVQMQMIPLTLLVGIQMIGLIQGTSGIVPLAVDLVRIC